MQLARLILLAGLASLAAMCGPAYALDAITFSAAEVRVGDTVAREVDARLDVLSTTRTRLSMRATSVSSSAFGAPARDVRIDCAAPVVREPRFACDAGRLRAAASPAGKIDAPFSAEYRSDRARFALEARRLQIAGGSAALAASGTAADWRADVSLAGTTVSAARTAVAPWLGVPKDLSIDGAVSGKATLRGGATLREAEVELRLTNVDLSNADGTIVAEKFAAVIGAKLLPGATRAARAAPAERRVELTIASNKGQALAGPVLLDFESHPLRLAATGRLAGGMLDLPNVTISQRTLLEASGSAAVALEPAPTLARAHLDLASLEFPAAYTSFLQIALAASDFGDLVTTGRAAGSIDIANNSPTAATLRLEAVDLADRKGKFRMNGATGVLHWVAAADAPVEPSQLTWKSGGAYGLEGGETRLDFKARALSLELLRPARIPVFDGAIAVKALAVRDLGQPTVGFDFDAEIEPISMPKLCKAFGWPEMAGQLAGRVPALQYRNHVLTFGGDVVARVFDGVITGSNLRLQDPLGPWPRFFADVTARNLDLGLVTRTFAVGSITGKLEGEIRNLELFAWSPIAFDARLATPAGDRSAHRISARAVGNLSNIGGGGGAVVNALQSGLLRFFDEYRYEKLGLQCRLRNEVCVMSGVEPAGMGYYIVKGSGIPRIDIIGNSGRVNWPQLVTQIVNAMQSESVTVR